MTPDMLSLLIVVLVATLGCAVLLGYRLGRREAGPTVARLAGEIDRLERHRQLEAAANDRLAALVPRRIVFRDQRFGQPPTLEVNGVPIPGCRAFAARDDMVLGRLTIAFEIEAGDWPVDAMLAAQPDPPAPFAAAGLVKLRRLLAEQLAEDESAEPATQQPAQPVS